MKPAKYQDITDVTDIRGMEPPDHMQDMTANQPAFDKQRISDAMMMLDNASHDLNAVSDGMRASIDAINAALKKVNPGVTAWLPLSSGETERALGYAKVNGGWCIALRESSGSRDAGTYQENIWPFNEASRWMRIDSVQRIPDLFDVLLARVRDMTEKMRSKVEFVNTLVDAIQRVSQDTTARPGSRTSPS